MKCAMCDHDITIHDRFCQNCGENNPQFVNSNVKKEQNLYSNKTEEWSGTEIFSFIASILLPFLGFLFYYHYKDTSTKFAKYCLYAAWVSTIIFFISMING
jgi:hypothetical protein